MTGRSGTRNHVREGRISSFTAETLNAGSGLQVLLAE